MTARVDNIEDNLTYPIHPTFEIGNITFYTTGREPEYGTSTSRVRTPQDNPLYLPAGATVALTNSTQMYIGYYDEETELWVSKGWISTTWTAPISTYYYILARANPEVDVTDPLAFEDYVTFSGLFEASVDHAKLEETNQMTSVAWAKNTNIRSIGHRGWPTVAPENTLPSFQLARLNGCDCVECDIQFTSDDVPVLLHDTTINRTGRNADGTEISTTINIGDITLEQAMQYDFGIWKSDKYEGTKIGTWEELVKFCKWTGMTIYAELKDTISPTDAQFEELVNIAKAYNMVDHIAWISFAKANLTPFLDLIEKPILGYVTNNLTETRKNAILDLKTQGADVFVDCDVKAITDDVISFCVTNDLELDSWTFKTAAEIIAAPSLIRGYAANGLNASVALYEEAMR